MSVPPDPKRQPPTGRQKAAIVIFMLTAFIPPLDYWQHGGQLTFFGFVPVSVLYVVASVGGAVSFVLYASGYQRTFAAIPGAIAGFGACGLHFLYTDWFEKETMWSAESLIVGAIGALPGILLFWGLSKLLKREETIPRDLVENPAHHDDPTSRPQ